METAVDEVDETVGEEDEEGELEPVVEAEGFIAEGVVEFGVAQDFGEEERSGEDGHGGHGVAGLFDFLSDLVLEEFGVFEGGFIENEDVREGGY